jgi:hypothetical protein
MWAAWFRAGGLPLTGKRPNVSFQFGRPLCCALVAVLLAGCGSAVLQTPGGSSTSLVGRRVSWISPEASRATLLYVTDPQDNLVYLISLPSGKLVGKLSGFDQPFGDCSDVSGDVFITDAQASEILEYKHASKSAFNVLSDHPNIPTDCSVDPTTGNVAVANCCSDTSHGGSLVVYKHAKGTGEYYQDPTLYVDWYCTYDDHGNLFVTGTNSNYSFQIDELPAGGQKLQQLTLNPVISGDVTPAILWDGSYLAIGSWTSAAIYQYAVGGTQATLVHTTTLKGFSGVGIPFWVGASGSVRTLYAPVIGNSVVSLGIFHYPRGGKAIEDLYDVADPFGVTLSLAPK